MQLPETLRILCIGAHPDDCEVRVGGTAARWRDRGHSVTLLSVTNGQSGHHEMAAPHLIARRRDEARRAAAVIGAESRVLSLPDGHLMPTLENRLTLIRVIREISPHVIVTNRPNDYHPDHRYASQLVQDSAYSLMVPGIAPDAPAMRFNPVILYWWDRFCNPVPFAPSVVVSIDAYLDRKIEMLHQHESQVYEWLPWVAGTLDAVPADASARLEWLRHTYAARQQPPLSALYRDHLRERYGAAEGERVREAEAYELCEYGARPGADELARLFAE